MTLSRAFSAYLFLIVAIATLLPLSKGGKLCQLRDFLSHEDVKEYRECLLRAEVEAPRSEGKETAMSSHLPLETGNDATANFHTFSYCDGLSAEQCQSLMDILEHTYQSVARQIEVPSHRFKRQAVADIAAYNGLDTPTIIGLLQQYYAWRLKKGYGKSVGRWGRSVDRVRSRRQAHGSSNEFYDTSDEFYEKGLDDLYRTGQMEEQPDNEPSAYETLNRLRNERWKTYRSLMNVLKGLRERRSLDWDSISMEQLKNNPQLMKMLYEYRSWRSKNGYGKLGGRYG